MDVEKMLEGYWGVKGFLNSWIELASSNIQPTQFPQYITRFKERKFGKAEL